MSGKYQDMQSLTMQFVGKLNGINERHNLKEEWPMDDMGELIPKAKKFLQSNGWNVEKAAQTVDPDQPDPLEYY